MLMESPLRCTNPPPGGVARRPLPAPDPHSTTPFPLPPSVQPWGPNAARHLHVPSAGADRLRLRHRPRPGLRLPDGHRRVLLRARHEGRRRHHHPGLPDHAPGPRFHRGQFNQSINQIKVNFLFFLGVWLFIRLKRQNHPRESTRNRHSLRFRLTCQARGLSGSQHWPTCPVTVSGEGQNGMPKIW